MKRSPQRGSFMLKKIQEKLEVDDHDQESLDMIEFYKTHNQHRLELEETTDWQTDNMEYDLRSTEWILKKVCENESYAQNLYAAMCNNDYTKNEVWPILEEKRWSCSWRHAGGIIADMQEKGDYIDWYCSGIRNDEPFDDDQYQQLTKEQQERYIQSRSFVSEGIVTEEIENDLLKLGWIVIKS